MAKERIFAGLSSGWAADGVDAALVSIAGRGERMKVRQLHAVHCPLDGSLQRRIRAAVGGDEQARPRGAGRLLAKLDRDVASAFAHAAAALIRESKIERDLILAVGSSGQPVARCAAGDGKSSGHRPALLELGGPPVIAEEVDLPVVGGFAASDLAAGGLGGPVAAWADWVIFHDRRLSRVVLHLGGVVSLSFIPAASVPTDVVAFDIGPCAVVLDALVREHCDAPCDRDGAIASRGRASPELLNELLSHPYFSAPPPKLTGGDEWGAVYLDRFAAMARGRRVSAGADRIATCTEMIARSVAKAVGGLTERPHEVVLAGGAARNIHLAQRIRMLLSPCSTYPVERYGFDARAYSAICCAVLAAARIDGKPAHCPSATGARRPAILGAVWPPCT